MARRIIIGEILNLIKGLGGNPNKFMGTRSNITFLGKGPKENLFQGPIDIEGMVQSGFPLQKVISEAESAGGYVTAGKLNDLQLQRLKDNLISLKKAYKPDQIPNITDLGTGTGGLTQEGLGSLRTKQLFGELPEGVEASETILPTGGLMGRISDRMKKIKDMSDELGQIGKGEADKAMTYEFLDPAAEKASYASRFNPKNEVHVNKAKALLEDPQLKGVYTEAEVKNAYDFDGLYQHHFDKGQVDLARFFEMEGHNIPQMRASARDALLQLMKKEKGAPGLEVGLRDFVDKVDFKYISEGGGGRAGDPINLMAKYFGKAATENLPKNATKENIDKFTDFIMNVRDARGRNINDPFFDRDTIDFRTFEGFADDLPSFKTGGRVPYMAGALVRGGKMGYQALRKYGIEAEDITRLFRTLGKDKILQGKEKAMYFRQLHKVLRNPDDYPEGIRDIQLKLGLDVGFGFKGGGLAKILEVSPFKTGGRVGFKWGSGLSKALLKRINKKMIKDAVDDIFPTGDYKMDAELASEALVELNPKLFGGKLLDDLDDAARSDVYGLVLGEVQTRFGLQLKKNRGIKSLIKGVDEKFGEGTLKRASELPKGTKYETLEAVKDFEARNKTNYLGARTGAGEDWRIAAMRPVKTMADLKHNIVLKYRGKLDDDLLDQILADNNEQRIAEVLATIDEALTMQRKGMGSDAIIQSFRDSWRRKPSASGGLAKILEV